METLRELARRVLDETRTGDKNGVYGLSIDQMDALCQRLGRSGPTFSDNPRKELYARIVVSCIRILGE